MPYLTQKLLFLAIIAITCINTFSFSQVGISRFVPTGDVDTSLTSACFSKNGGTWGAYEFWDLGSLSGGFFHGDSLLQPVWGKKSLPPIQRIREFSNGDIAIAGWVLVPPSNDRDMFIARYDSLGNPKWAFTYGNLTFHQDIADLETTSDGGLIVSGRNFNVLGYPRPLVFKIDSLGNTIWSREVNWGSINRLSVSAFEGPDKGIYVTMGSSVFKLDSMGNNIWGRYYGDNYQSRIGGVAVGPGNKVYVIGSYRLDTFNPVIHGITMIKADAIDGTYIDHKRFVWDGLEILHGGTLSHEAGITQNGLFYFLLNRYSSIYSFSTAMVGVADTNLSIISMRGRSLDMGGFYRSDLVPDGENGYLLTIEDEPDYGNQNRNKFIRRGFPENQICMGWESLSLSPYPIAWLGTGLGGNNTIVQTGAITLPDSSYNYHLGIGCRHCRKNISLSFSQFSTGYTANFNSTTTGLDSLWWDFGDGTTSSLPNPVHTYPTTSATYRVCLHGENYSCYPDSFCLDVPICDFLNFELDSVACAGIPLNITNNSNPGLSFSWFIGSSLAGTGFQPNIVPYSPGYFPITCQAWDSFCSDVQTEYIQLTGPSPIVNFNYNPNGLTVQFNDNSQWANIRLWDFGDGTTDSNPNPTHTFATPGSYTVCLVVENNCGIDSFCDTVTVPGVGISKNQFEGIEVFPNPTNDKLIINFPLGFQLPAQITLVNTSGIRSINEPVESFKTEINLQGFPKGVYMLLIESNGKKYSKLITHQ